MLGRLGLLLAVVCACNAFRYREKQEPKSNNCYQCAYSPPDHQYKEIRVPVEVEEQVRVPSYDGKGFQTQTVIKKVWKIKKVTEKSVGGWDKCKGPFADWQALEWGIDVWKCPGNCYARRDVNGNIFRGCFQGAFGIDQTRLGCGIRADGSNWCFCEGDKCNSHAVPLF